MAKFVPPRVYSYFDPPGDDGYIESMESKTQQDAKDECDINLIMRRALATGQLPEALATAQYGDFSEVADYHQAQNILVEAQAQFAMLPSGVRDKFRNDPAMFLDFIHNKDNVEEARKLGLLKDKPVAAPAEVPGAEVKPPA